MPSYTPTGRSRGNPPTVPEIRRKLGNPSHRPFPALGQVTHLAPASGVPEPMRPLGQMGFALWERVWLSGAVWLAAGIDAEPLLVLCEQVDERAALRIKVLRVGDRWDRAALRALDAQVMSGLGVLGFNPVDRARMGVAEVVPDALDSHMARRQQRSGNGS